MKPQFPQPIRFLALVAVLLWTADTTRGQDILVKPVRGGGLDTNAPMIHVDIFYDYGANQMHATLDTSHGTPHLNPLPPGYAFDSRSNYAVLADKAYSLQYAWNPGGVFSPPEGAAVWIECLSASPGLEVYDGPGNKMENPPRPYTPILGTAGSSTKWSWYGRMAHNATAVRSPTTNVLTAEYLVYFGDAQTGSREAFANYDDATVTLTWTAEPPLEPPTFLFGAVDPTPGAPLAFLNADQCASPSESVVSLRPADSGPWASECSGFVPLVAVAATAAHAGPVAGHAAPGSRLELELVSLVGPPGGTLSIWEAGDTEPRLRLRVGEAVTSKHLCLSQCEGAPGDDPYGQIRGRRFSLSRPGLYSLGFRLVDTSTNGPDGGPIHAPSEVYQVFLQGGLTLAPISGPASSMTASFAAEPGKSYCLDRASALGPLADWETVAGPVAGANRLLTLTDPDAPKPQGFYRLRASIP